MHETNFWLIFCKTSDLVGKVLLSIVIVYLYDLFVLEYSQDFTLLVVFKLIFIRCFLSFMALKEMLMLMLQLKKQVKV